MKVFIIIPAYNEEKRILETLKNYQTLFRSKGIEPYLVIVSESTDKTNRIIRSVAKGNKRILQIYTKKRLGKGGAIIKGFSMAVRKSSKSDIIGFVDSDNAVHVSEITKMLNYLQKHKGFDGIIASRYINGSSIYGHLPLSRLIASRGYNMLIRLLFGLDYSDTQCGAKLFRYNAVKSILSSLSIVDMSFDINLLYSLKIYGFRIKEFPIKYNQVNEGSRLILHKQVPQMLIATLGFRLSRSRFGKLFPDSVKGYIYDKVKRW